jgi:hypothetical protein
MWAARTLFVEPAPGKIAGLLFGDIPSNKSQTQTQTKTTRNDLEILQCAVGVGKINDDIENFGRSGIGVR